MNTPVGGTPPAAASAAPPPADTEAPTSPGSLAASGAQNQITLSWTASTDNVGVTGYSRYQNGVLGSSAAGTSYTFTGLACATTYTLGVDSYDAAGNRSTRASLTAATSACPVSDTTAPSVPQGMQVTSSSQVAISIAWNASTDNVGVSGYRLYRNDSLIGTTASLSYPFSGLTCGTTYALGVEAFDAAGNRLPGLRPH